MICAMRHLVLLLALAVPAWADDDGQTVTLQPENGFVAFKACYKDFSTTPERPSSVRAVPEGIESWLVFPWGSKHAVIGLGTGVLWPDRDGDGDLKEEEPVGQSHTTHIELDLRMPSRTIRTKLQLKTHGQGRWRITNLTRMSGQVEIGGRTVPVSLTDYLVNGRYDDLRTTQTEEYWLCDHVHFDLDGDGKFRRRIPPWGEDFSLARAFVFDGVVYALTVLDGGERMRFEATKRPLLPVKVNTPRFVVRLVSDELGCVSIEGEKGAARLPAGRYLFDAYEYEIGEGEVSGLFWKEDGRRWLDVAEGTTIEIAGKLRYDLSASQDKDGILRFRSICFGPLGDRVMLYPKRGTGNNVEPELTVETRAGDVLHRVRSGYC